MKKIRAVFLLLVVSLALAIPAQVFAETEATDISEVSFTIFHTNDMHGRLHDAEFPNTIGLDVVRSIVNSVEYSLLIDAGDTINGVPFVNFSEGLNAVRLMSLAGYSFMTPGNHDFNFGVNRLIELEEYAEFGILAANVFWNTDNSLVFDAYATVEIAGLTVGFFGLVTPSTPIVTHPNNVRDINFGDPAAAAELAIAALQALEVDMIIAVTHLGYEGGYERGFSSRELALAVEGIDLIIDGHSHTTLEEGSLVGGTLIVQAFEHGRTLGRVDITVAGSEISMAASLIDRDYAFENFDRDEEVATLIQEMVDEISEIADVVVAYTPNFLEGDRRYIRTQELPLGNLVADAFAWSSGADLAIMNSGAIRDSLEAGDITFGDVARILPFINYLVVVEITPSILWEALENGVSQWPQDNGRFPQVSGFSFSFDGYAEAGSRVLNVVVNGVELDKNDTSTVFTLAITDFKANGGDAYDMFIGLPRVSEDDLKSSIFTTYITSDAVDLTIGIEGRILQVGEEIEEDNDYQTAVTLPYELEENNYQTVVTLPHELSEEELANLSSNVEETATETTTYEVTTRPVGTAIVVNAWMVNVREEARTDSRAISALNRDAVVIVLEGPVHGWYRVQFGEVTGWVFQNFLDIM